MRSNTPFRMLCLLTVQGGFVHVDMRFNFEKCYKSLVDGYTKQVLAYVLSESLEGKRQIEICSEHITAARVLRRCKQRIGE